MIFGIFVFAGVEFQIQFKRLAGKIQPRDEFSVFPEGIVTFGNARGDRAVGFEFVVDLVEKDTDIFLFRGNDPFVKRLFRFAFRNERELFPVLRACGFFRSGGDGI